MAKLISFPRPGKDTVVWVNPDTVRAVLQKGGVPDQTYLYFNSLTDKECLLVQGDAAAVAARLNRAEG